MSREAWTRVLSDIESALERLEHAGPDDIETVVLTLPADPADLASPIPAVMVERARRLEGRLAGLIAEFEARRAAVGSEIAAIAASPGPADRAVPKFLDTKA